jgi:hypothetical protein
LLSNFPRKSVEDCFSSHPVSSFSVDQGVDTYRGQRVIEQCFSNQSLAGQKHPHS